MLETVPPFTINDISSETGVKIPTIKSWQIAGVVPAAVSRRPDGMNYTETHMRRVKMVRDWLESRITLEEMAERIEILGEKALEVPDPYADFDGWE